MPEKNTQRDGGVGAFDEKGKALNQDCIKARGGGRRNYLLTKSGAWRCDKNNRVE